MQFDQDGSGKISEEELNIYYANQCQQYIKKDKNSFYSDAKTGKLDTLLRKVTDLFEKNNSWKEDMPHSYLMHKMDLIRLACQGLVASPDQLAGLDELSKNWKGKRPEEECHLLFGLLKKWDVANGSYDKEADAGKFTKAVVETLWVTLNQSVFQVAFAKQCWTASTCFAIVDCTNFF